jgi:uncharacterized protein (DUF488 family)
MKLFTIGYEGADIDDFVKYLKKNKIKLIADVRKNPISRKKGFSKNKLREALALKKIAYAHFPNLGVPSSWRKEAKTHFITRERMFKDYSEKILPRATKDLSEIIDLAKKENVALMCYEADASDCHRSYAHKKMQKLNRTKIKIIDLELKKTSN